MEEIRTTPTVETALSFSLKSKSTTTPARSILPAPPSVFRNVDSDPDDSDDPDQMSMSARDGATEGSVSPAELFFCREEGGRLAERGEFEVFVA